MSNWALRQESRAWQSEALAAWRAAHMHGVARVVTGAGKTIFAQACMLHFRGIHPDGVVVIVVPTLALIDQWFVSLVDDLGVRENEIAIFSGTSKPSKFSAVNVMTLNASRNKAEALSDLGNVFLIVDECHKVGSNANSRILKGKFEATLGLSATPERQYDDALERLIIPALGPIIFDYDYNRARREGVIAPFELINVAIELQKDEREEYDRISRRVADLFKKKSQGIDSSEQIVRALRRRAAVSARAAMRVPVTVHLVDQHRGSRILVFHEAISAAELICDRLASRNHNATIYHSQIGESLRRDNLRLFKKGMFDVLVSCRALDEGINVPETTVAIVSSSTASIRQRIQRLGRALRPAPGKVLATIYTLYATEVEEKRLVEEGTRLSEAERISWKKSSINP